MTLPNNLGNKFICVNIMVLVFYWKISIGALQYKAKKTTLSNNQYTRWITRLAPNRKKEPNDIEIEEPILLKKNSKYVKMILKLRMIFLTRLVYLNQYLKKFIQPL